MSSKGIIGKCLCQCFLGTIIKITTKDIGFMRRNIELLQEIDNSLLEETLAELFGVST